MDTTLVTEALSAATTLFGVFSTLAVVVTGFFLGRRWLAKAGVDSDGVDDDSSPMAFAGVESVSDLGSISATGEDSAAEIDLPDFPEMKDAAGVYADDWASENPWVIVDDDVYVRREDLDQYYDAKRARSENGEYWK